MNRGGFGISLDSPAPTGGLVVNLASTDSSIASVPPSVTIPAGLTYLPNGFVVTGQSTGGLASQTVQITASAPGWTGTTAQITVVNPILQLQNAQTAQTTASPPENVWVDVRQPGCYCGDVLNAPLTITITADPSGMVNLINAQITIPAGGNTTYYVQQTTVGTPTGDGSYTLSASAPGFNTVSVTVTVTN
jgi:hypothetical protein